MDSKGGAVAKKKLKRVKDFVLGDVLGEGGTYPSHR
jgi:hypothetical protein